MSVHSVPGWERSGHASGYRRVPPWIDREIAEALDEVAAGGTATLAVARSEAPEWMQQAVYVRARKRGLLVSCRRVGRTRDGATLALSPAAMSVGQRRIDREREGRLR